MTEKRAATTRLTPVVLTAALFVLALAFSTPNVAAELPSEDKALPAPKKGVQPHGGLPSCDVGGLTGVLANGVCVRMSGHISGEVTGRQLR